MTNFCSGLYINTGNQILGLEANVVQWKGRPTLVSLWSYVAGIRLVQVMYFNLFHFLVFAAIVYFIAMHKNRTVLHLCAKFERYGMTGSGKSKHE